MPGQFILQYYVDNTAKKLKGSVDLDQCEQVCQTETDEALATKSTVNYDSRSTLASPLSVAR